MPGPVFLSPLRATSVPHGGALCKISRNVDAEVKLQENAEQIMRVFGGEDGCKIKLGLFEKGIDNLLLWRMN